VPAYLIRLINHAMTRLCAVLGHPPTIAELAEALEIDPGICERAFQALDRPISLSAPAELEDAPLSETVPDASVGDPETLALDGAAREELDRLLDVLPARERMILRGRFGLDGPARTFEELARMHVISSARVRQLYHAALARLRGIISWDEVDQALLE
jgi:DNA-directed RNA polymerase sigma subunit (sigma70/sigma32)